ncbi:HNH endonuclease signature motif containing protein [Microbacterium lacus]|uniref:HNH endonuclease signature motif containing protein n=1 Tax=Microbacterium lacus TaxID=415217 RepID=UPI0018E2498C|nr:HNH endonuclease signature motif containing protein [Microbacterium lacus]
MTSDVPSPLPRLTSAVERMSGVMVDREFTEFVRETDDDTLLVVLADAADARKALDLIVAAATAEVGHRSTRELGYAGLAQRKGHRNVTSLVQNITGQSRGDVGRSLRTGEELVPVLRSEGAVEGAPVGPDTPPVAGHRAGHGAVTWLSMLRGALTSGALSSPQFQAIRTGLGEPPVERYPELDPAFLPEAWARAVALLIEESGHLPVEELRAAARIARDRLDPVGVTLRFEERFAARSFRAWIDENGQHHARIVFDDDAAAWVHAILQASLRPRRGPRFVGEDAPERAADSAVDERTNEQLQYDTVLAVLRTGAAADPNQSFGDRQPGVRILLEATAIEGAGMEGADSFGGKRVAGVGHLEDGGQALPGGVVETYLCDAGAVEISRDSFGRPLDVGREHRLFTRRQRIAIAARDGGCIWPECIAPISQCEYHHIKHWWEDHGATDVDDGVPLCRNCHLRLHNQGWRITRERDPDSGLDSYWLHPPPDPLTGVVPERVRLPSKAPTRFEAA